jgi:hypothetical protein
MVFRRLKNFFGKQHVRLSARLTLRRNRQLFPAIPTGCFLPMNYLSC